MSGTGEGKVYTIPKGFVTADPGRNRYVRRRGTSLEQPPRLNPDYSHDIADPKNGIDLVGVGTQLGAVAAASAGAVAFPPVVVGSSAVRAGLAGMQALDELAHEHRKCR